MKKNNEEELKKRFLTKEDLIKMIDEEKEHLKLDKEIMEGDEINQEEDDSEEWEDLYIRQLEETDSAIPNLDCKEEEKFLKNQEEVRKAFVDGESVKEILTEIKKIKNDYAEMKEDISELFKMYEDEVDDFCEEEHGDKIDDFCEEEYEDEEDLKEIEEKENNFNFIKNPFWYFYDYAKNNLITYLDTKGLYEKDAVDSIKYVVSELNNKKRKDEEKKFSVDIDEDFLWKTMSLIKQKEKEKENGNSMFDEVVIENEKMFDEVINLIKEKELLKEEIFEKDIEIEKLKQQIRKEEMRQVEKKIYKRKEDIDELKNRIKKRELDEVEEKIYKNNEENKKNKKIKVKIN